MNKMFSFVPLTSGTSWSFGQVSTEDELSSDALKREFLT